MERVVILLMKNGHKEPFEETKGSFSHENICLMFENM